MEVRNNKTLLLTGITGFLGSHILKSLIEDNMYKIICLKRSFSNMRRIADLETRNVVFYNIDLIDLDSVFIKNKIEIENEKKNRFFYFFIKKNFFFKKKIKKKKKKYIFNFLKKKFFFLKK